MNKNHDALIERIDAWFDFRKPKSATGDVINHDCPRDEFAAELLQDCRAALSQSEPVRYVPMTAHEWMIFIGDQYFCKYEDAMRIESEVIRRAGLEVAND